MPRYVDLKRYMPLYLSEFKELKSLLQAENPEFQKLFKAKERMKDNQFIISCDPEGIKRFEAILEIAPPTEEGLNARISKALTRWNDVDPYTWNVFIRKLNSLCGPHFELIPHWEHFGLEINAGLDSYGQLEELERLVAYILPANIEARTTNSLAYTTKGDLYIGTIARCVEMFTITDGVAS